MIVEIKKNGNIYRQEYRRGKSQDKLQVVGVTEETGTKITFKPDPLIFSETITFDAEVLRVHLQQCAFLNRALKITFSDLRNPEKIKSLTFAMKVESRNMSPT